MKFSTIAPVMALGVVGSNKQVMGFIPRTQTTTLHNTLAQITPALVQGANTSPQHLITFLPQATTQVLPLFSYRTIAEKSSSKPHNDRTPNNKPAYHIGIEPDSLNIQSKNGSYPTLGNKGITYKAMIDGIEFSSQEVAELQSYIWKTPQENINAMDFLPKQAIKSLSGQLKILSDLAEQMPVELADGSPGLLANNLLRHEVFKLDNGLIQASKDLVTGFKNAQTQQDKQQFAEEIQNLSVFAQWLIRGFLFEGPLHQEPYVSPVVPSPLSVISAIANQATGLLQKEFVYHSYTLLPAELPNELQRTFDELDYNNPAAILDAIARIKTTVGFNDVTGNQPEHNFRFNHVLMEYQMRAVFEGYQQVKAGNAAGLDKMVEGYRRAHKVFETMLTNTPASSYPKVRLPITAVEGKRGIASRLSIYPSKSTLNILLRGLQKTLRGDRNGPALIMESIKRFDQQLATQLKTTPIFASEMSLYPPQGVLYEGLGDETLTDAFSGQRYVGQRPPPVPGQTGANSSMYKLADVFIQVAKLRQAYEIDSNYFEKLSAVMLKKLPYTQLGKDPIDSMMLAFDALTRPDLHQQTLVETYEEVNRLEIFQNPTREQKVKLLEISYWVAKHRLRHGQYVNKAIFSQPPKANQSRAEGTGGSTIQFLKRFFDDTLKPARTLIQELKNDQTLSETELRQVLEIEVDLLNQEEQMIAVDKKGRELAQQEGKADLAKLSAQRPDE